jgi:hypothetical protein
MLLLINSAELVVESINELIDPNMELLHWAQAVEFGKGIHYSAYLLTVCCSYSYSMYDNLHAECCHSSKMTCLYILTRSSCYILRLQLRKALHIADLLVCTWCCSAGLYKQPFERHKTVDAAMVAENARDHVRTCECGAPYSEHLGYCRCQVTLIANGPLLIPVVFSASSNLQRSLVLYGSYTKALL